jgi:hypothetical protein
MHIEFWLETNIPLRRLRRKWDYNIEMDITDRLYGLVVRVPGYRSGGSGSISGATRFSEE